MMSVGQVTHGLSKEYHVRKYRIVQPIIRTHSQDLLA